jgi:hypothetical protein
LAGRIGSTLAYSSFNREIEGVVPSTPAASSNFVHMLFI